LQSRNCSDIGTSKVERKGKKLLITPADMASKIARLQIHADCIAGDPGDLVHMDWASEWKPEV